MRNETIDLVIRQALETAELKISEIDGFAATAEYGLIGGVTVGAVITKAISAACSALILQ